MTSKALRLAKEITAPAPNYYSLDDAAAELIRLHEVNVELVKALKEIDLLIGMEPFEHVSQEAAEAHEQIRAAIAKATGDQNEN